MVFSRHRDMTYKNSALQEIFVKLLFIEFRLSKKIPLYMSFEGAKGAKLPNSGYLL